MSVSGFLKGLAPWLSASAGFLPGGPVIQIAAKKLGEALSKEIKPTPQDVTAAMNELSTSEEGRIKLAQIDNEFKEVMLKAGYDHQEKLIELAVQDRESARKREEVVKDLTPSILAYAMFTLAAAITVLIVMGWSPAAKDAITAGLVGTIIGYVFGELKLITAYYFGSSSDSSKQSEMLYNSTPAGKDGK